MGLSKQCKHDQAEVENNNPEPNGPRANEQMITNPDDPAGPQGLGAGVPPEMMYGFIKPTKPIMGDTKMIEGVGHTAGVYIKISPMSDTQKLCITREHCAEAQLVNLPQMSRTVDHNNGVGDQSVSNSFNGCLWLLFQASFRC